MALGNVFLLQRTLARVRAARPGAWLDRGVLLAVLLAGAVAVSPNPADPDLWGHVQYGRDVLAHGLPLTTTYSYTAEGYPWINHENLAELLLALGADTIGPVGLLTAKCLLGVGVLTLILRRALKLGAAMLSAGAVTLLVAVNLAYHWSVRPQLLSYVDYALLLWLLCWCFAGWEGQWRLPRPGRREEAAARLAEHCRLDRLRWLWLVPILTMAWANSHGGFVAGLSIYLAYLGCRALEALACWGWAAARLVARLALLGAAAVATTFINPYGPRLHLWLVESLGTPRPEITEWRAPDFFDPLSIPLWLILAVFAAALGLSRRRWDFTHLAVLGLTLWQALAHQRHIPFFALAFGFWAAPHVDDVLKRFRVAGVQQGWAAALRPAARRGLGVALAAAFVLLGARLYGRLSDMPVDKQVFPVSAVQYMADEGLEGRVVVTYNWAQYVIAALGRRPDEPGGVLVGFDGRFRTAYPQHVVDMHFDFVLGDGGPERRWRSPQSPPFDEGRVLQYGHPDLVLLCRAQPHSEQVMERRRGEWVLLYQDAVAQLWGRASKYDDPDQAAYIPPERRVIGDAAPTGSVTWPALPQHRPPEKRTGRTRPHGA